MRDLVLIAIAVSCGVLVGRWRDALAAGEACSGARRRRELTAALEEADRQRRQVAFTLHDGPLQTLLSLRQDLEEAMLAPAAADPARWAAALRRAGLELDTALGGHDGAATGLHSALAGLVLTAHAEHGLRARLALDEDAARGREELLAAVARELVTNVLRHADASRLEVDVRREGDDAALRVRDDGRGLPPARLQAAPAGGHVGFASCRSRAEEAGGTIEVTPRPGGGTEVTLRVPAGDLVGVG